MSFAGDEILPARRGIGRALLADPLGLAGLVLVASNPFLGELKEHLDTQSRQRVLRTVPSDYTSLDERELAQRLAAT